MAKRGPRVQGSKVQGSAGRGTRISAIHAMAEELRLERDRDPGLQLRGHDADLESPRHDGDLRAPGRVSTPSPRPALALHRYRPPLTELASLSTARLLPTRYSDSVLIRIADSDADLPLLYALDNATNERLLAEANGRLGITARELVYDGPYSRIINAAFTHPHPQGARFSTPYRGAWYAAWELATAKAEVLFHRSVQLTEIGWAEEEWLDYDHYSAEFSGAFHDLRPDLRPDARVASESWEPERVACLAPRSYVASQQLASELLEAGSRGILYPSTRRPGGTCLACFQPEAVRNIRKRGLHRLLWRPDAPAIFSRVTREPTAGTPGPRAVIKGDNP